MGLDATRMEAETASEVANQAGNQREELVDKELGGRSQDTAETVKLNEDIDAEEQKAATRQPEPRRAIETKTSQRRRGVGGGGWGRRTGPTERAQ